MQDAAASRHPVTRIAAADLVDVDANEEEETGAAITQRYLPDGFRLLMLMAKPGLARSSNRMTEKKRAIKADFMHVVDRSKLGTCVNRKKTILATKKSIDVVAHGKLCAESTRARAAEVSLVVTKKNRRN